MKQAKILRWVVAVFVVVTVLAAFQYALEQESAEELYQAALFTKNVDGDLRGAIELFKKIIKEFPDNRKICAQAHLQLGMCYEKLGMEQARNSYKQVIDSYPEQTDAVKTARDKLSELRGAEKAAERGDQEFQIRLVGQGLDSLGEISPDNRYLCCADWETSNLAVIDMASGEMLRLTSHERSESASPDVYEAPGGSVWAPDQKRIAYTWYGAHPLTCELRMIGIDDKKPRLLYQGDYYKDWVMPHDWSPDGKTILTGFLREEGWKLGLLSVEDSSVYHLISLQFGEPHAAPYYAKFSPDGRFIVYNHPQEKDPSKSDISLLSADGKQKMPLVHHPADDRLMGCSPDGNWILFTSDRTGTWDAWIMPVSNGQPKGDPKLIRREIGVINPMGISRTGSFYYSTPGFRNDIFYSVIDPTTGEVIEPARKYPLSYEGQNRYPDLSPDGKHLVYVSNRGHRTLCIYSLESGEEREISLKGKFHGFGRSRWMPDGRSILIEGNEQERGRGWYKVDVKTGSTTLIIPHGAWSLEAAAPDGKTVYYDKLTTSKEFFQIMKRDIETGEEQELYRIPPYDNTTLDLSPDGKRLALMMREDETTRALKVLPVEGGEPVVLHKFEKDRQVKYIDVTWSPDGCYVYFSKQKPKGDGVWELWRIPSEGGEAQNLRLAMHGFTQLNIHPDGSRITFASRTMHENVGAVWVMENFLPKEKKAENISSDKKGTGYFFAKK
jgi:Tol biopolymer transport system component